MGKEVCVARKRWHEGVLQVRCLLHMIKRRRATRRHIHECTYDGGDPDKLYALYQHQLPGWNAVLRLCKTLTLGEAGEGYTGPSYIYLGNFLRVHNDFKIKI